MHLRVLRIPFREYSDTGKERKSEQIPTTPTTETLNKENLMENLHINIEVVEEKDENILVMSFSNDTAPEFKAKMSFHEFENFTHELISIVKAINLAEAKEYMRRKNEEQKLIESASTA